MSEQHTDKTNTDIEEPITPACSRVTFVDEEGAGTAGRHRWDFVVLIAVILGISSVSLLALFGLLQNLLTS